MIAQNDFFGVGVEVELGVQVITEAITLVINAESPDKASNQGQGRAQRRQAVAVVFDEPAQFLPLGRVEPLRQICGHVL